MTDSGTLSRDGAIRLEVKNDDALPKFTQQEFHEMGKELLVKSRSGYQFAVVDDNGSIIQVVGMNGLRVLPERDLSQLCDLGILTPKLTQESSWSE